MSEPTPDTTSDSISESDPTSEGTLETAVGFAAAQAILKPRKARPFYGRHPWVLDSAIARIEGEAADGDVVDLMADTGKFVARGIYNSQSRIRVRLYTWDITPGARRRLLARPAGDGRCAADDARTRRARRRVRGSCSAKPTA